MSILEDNYPVSNKITQFIEKKGMKQVYIAEKAGFTPKELSDMLNGRRLIRVCDIPKLAFALGVTPNDLLAPLKPM